MSTCRRCLSRRSCSLNFLKGCALRFRSRKRGDLRLFIFSQRASMDLREIALAKVSRSLAVLAFEGGHAVTGLLTPPPPREKRWREVPNSAKSLGVNVGLDHDSLKSPKPESSCSKEQRDDDECFMSKTFAVERYTAKSSIFSSSFGSRMAFSARGSHQVFQDCPL